uniref:Uncharacterized protein n=1 Tax=Oryza brachyantha TaxID=4533 RepID=J3NC17_ORYBR
MEAPKSTASRGSRSGVKSPNPRRRSASTGGAPRLGRWTCCHGEEAAETKPWLPPAEKSFESIEKFYLEAAHRLPLEEIPELVDCLGEVGYCFGLADPVTNVVLNAVAQLGSSFPDDGGSTDLEEEPPPPSPPRKRTRRTYTQCWGFAPFYSFVGLMAFMKVYFRYLTDDQARHYLYLASYDLLLAIKLVHQDRRLPRPRPSLLPDGGKMKTALRVAALQARHFAPEDLLQTMTARYPSHLLSPIIDKLRGSELLTAGDVWAIRDLLLLARQCLPPNVDFSCCPNGDACTQSINHGGTVQLATCIGGGAFVRISTEIVTPNHAQSQPLQYISDLTFDGAAMETKLSKCTTTGSGGCEVNYDLSPPCEYMLSLKMCLLDAIHGFYIRALTVLPLPPTGSDGPMPRGRLLRALLVSGHCYGPLDPVANIILNAILFDATNLPHEGEGEAESLLPHDIFDTHAMSRMASCSLDGLVALLRAITTTTTGAPLSKHEAVEYLWSTQCDLTEKLQPTAVIKKNPYAAAAKASKHPQHTMLGSLLMSLSGETLGHLRYLLRSTSDGSAGCVISSADWEQLNTMIKEQLATMTIMRELLPFDPQVLAASSRGSANVNLQSFARTKLEELLLRYSRQHPWEPRYKLDLICGVQQPRSHLCRCYHANFLASAHSSVLIFNGETITAPTIVRTLFFAEFWDSEPGRFYESIAKPICCPVQDYCTRFGHCNFCREASTIVHPPYSTRSHRDDGGDVRIRDYNVNAIRMYVSVLCICIYGSVHKSKDKGLLEFDIIERGSNLTKNCKFKEWGWVVMDMAFINETSMSMGDCVRKRAGMLECREELRDLVKGYADPVWLDG